LIFNLIEITNIENSNNMAKMIVLPIVGFLIKIIYNYSLTTNHNKKLLELEIKM